MSEKYMIIDGIRTAFTDEKNILQVIRKAGIMYQPFVIIPICPFTGRVVCVWWKTSAEA